jgi:hypothetical protein
MSIEYFKENAKDTYDFLKKMSTKKREYNSKLMDYTFDSHFFVDYDMIH